MNRRSIVRLGLVSAALLLGPVIGMVGDAAAAPDPVLDGRLDEAAWSEAERLEVGPTASAPRVRVLVVNGSLWIGIEVSEAPGPGMGFSALLAPPGVDRAADAVALAYAPQDPRSPRYVARGPRGVGRTVYRLEAAADVKGRDAWSVEARIPLADLGLPAEAGAGALKVALAVRHRRPEILAWAPPASAFAAPSAWADIMIPAAAHAVTAPHADAASLAAEDALDAERREAWRLFLAAGRRSAELMVQARGYENALDPTLTREALRSAVALPLLEPLDQILALRPDLAIVHVVRGDVLRQLGESAPALEAYAAADRVVPGLPEASFGAWIQTRGPSFAGGPAGDPTDYVGAREALANTTPPDGDAIAADGLAYAGALLDLAEGGDGFRRGAKALEKLREAYGFDQFLGLSAERARAATRAWGAEGQRRRAEGEADDLPRVRLDTARGTILLELFEDDVPNSVYQFVHLVRKGAYDGVTVGTTIPFLAALGGLDLDPGYAIPTERGGATRARGAFRGTLGYLGTGRDTEAAAFFLTTGTATHLGGEFVVLGRVLEGQEAVDALRKGDVIQRATLVRTRPGVTYRPVTVEGKLAPEGD